MTKASKKKDHLKKLEDEFDLSPEKWGDLITEDSGYFAARVVEVHKRYAFVSSEPTEGNINTRDVWLATVARRHLQAARHERNVFSVGDRVLCQPGTGEVGNISQELPQCTVVYRAPRVSKVARLDPMTPEREHIIAANCDQLVIVASYLAPKVKWGLIDRYLVLAEEQELPATIVLNKLDLLESEGSEEFIALCREYEEIYRKLGYQVISLSAASTKPRSETWQVVADLFKDKISLLSGHSGVGKSSLVNLLKPEIVQDVEDEDILSKGRHTTTYASFIKLGTGGYVIDTPGIRSFLIEERSSIDLSYAFVEMRPFMNQCKYRECQHVEEPDCAIKKAVSENVISSLRYQSYVGILTGATGREGRLRGVEDLGE